MMKNATLQQPNHINEERGCRLCVNQRLKIFAYGLRALGFITSERTEGRPIAIRIQVTGPAYPKGAPASRKYLFSTHDHGRPCSGQVASAFLMEPLPSPTAY